MSKRDDDSQADMEVGMTTAERRRRRRRGGGLRVPSDNVPRRTTTPPVVAPVPEDPSLAMSIAYAFTNDASEPVPRATPTPDPDVPSFADPSAPDAMPTVIDPPSAPVEQADFEMKTREMTAVDLEALGLTDHHPAPARASAPTLDSEASADDLASRLGRPRRRTQQPPLGGSGINAVPADTDDGATRQMAAVEAPVAPPAGNSAARTVDRLTTEPGVEAPAPAPAPVVAAAPAAPQAQPPGPRERQKTVALSEEDLEEVREAYARAMTPPAEESTTPAEATSPKPKLGINTTQPLSALDIEVEDKPPEGSVPEIDINELADRADSTGEFDVDIDEPEPPEKPVPQVAAVTPPPPTPAGPPERRSRPPSVPPPLTPDKAPAASAATPAPAATTPPSPPAAAPTSASPPVAPAASATHAQPPPPPKAPPTPPPKAKPAAAAAPAPRPEGKGARAKAWFVDLFDEDYLRTLPFLTPQATQAEAEFVIDSMGLAPGAQVLDVGCGYGRHAMELAARGFHMVGLDLSTPLLVRGGEEAMRRGLEINFVRGDMRELDFDAQFDGAYCLFSTFGYFDDETNKKTIANIARALKPGGRLMIEILNRDYVIADLPTRVWWEGDGCVVLEEVELNYFSSRIQVNRSVVFDDGRQLEQEISVRAYSLHEVGKLMHAAGFRVLEVSGGYHTRGRFFGNQSRHIIVLAERKDSAPA